MEQDMRIKLISLGWKPRAQSIYQSCINLYGALTRSRTQFWCLQGNCIASNALRAKIYWTDVEQAVALIRLHFNTPGRVQRYVVIAVTWLQQVYVSFHLVTGQLIPLTFTASTFNIRSIDFVNGTAPRIRTQLSRINSPLPTPSLLLRYLSTLHQYWWL